jgi:hypothetical protein
MLISSHSYMGKVKDLIKKIETNDEYRKEFFTDPGTLLERELGEGLRISDALKAELKREATSQKRKLSRTIKPVTAIGARTGRAGRRGKRTSDRLSVVM